MISVRWLAQLDAYALGHGKTYSAILISNNLSVKLGYWVTFDMLNIDQLVFICTEILLTILLTEDSLAHARFCLSYPFPLSCLFLHWFLIFLVFLKNFMDLSLMNCNSELQLFIWILNNQWMVLYGNLNYMMPFWSQAFFPFFYHNANLLLLLTCQLSYDFAQMSWWSLMKQSEGRADVLGLFTVDSCNAISSKFLVEWSFRSIMVWTQLSLLLLFDLFLLNTSLMGR